MEWSPVGTITAVFDRLEGVVLRDHAERIARLEARFD